MRAIWMTTLLAAASCAAHAQEGVSFVNEGIVEAPVAEVWKLFSTSDGYKALGPAQAEVDLKIGGIIRSRYGSDGPLGDSATIENQILAYEPPVMMALRIQKPPANFPFKEAWKNTWTVITLVPLENDRTRVRAASLGYGTDEESVALRRFFEAGNDVTIRNVQKRFGPVPASGSKPQ
jgi:uncharacterized protein YndB with AHSA1/START domain